MKDFQWVNPHTWIVPTVDDGEGGLFGKVGLLDLRILGLMKELPARPLNQFVRLGRFRILFSFMTGAARLSTSSSR